MKCVLQKNENKIINYLIPSNTLNKELSSVLFFLVFKHATCNSRVFIGSYPMAFEQNYFTMLYKKGKRARKLWGSFYFYFIYVFYILGILNKMVTPVALENHCMKDHYSQLGATRLIGYIVLRCNLVMLSIISITHVLLVK